MVGVLTVTWTVVRELLSGVALPLPLPVMLLFSAAQSGLLLFFAVWAGVAFAPRVSLAAPFAAAAVAGAPAWPALRRQLLPALIGGLIGGLLLVLLARHVPPALNQFDPPLAARMLYGGLTEELLCRWGIMSLLLWTAWRLLQFERSLPSASLAWVSIVASAAIFALAHLPAAAALAGGLRREIIIYVVIGNTAFGVLAGYLFWRHGLETAMICHAMSHLVAYSASV